MTGAEGMDTQFTKPHHICGFCGRAQNEIRKLIHGPTGFICDFCVSDCLAMYLRQDAGFFEEVIERAKMIVAEDQKAED